ncbi:MAG: hypothetical protein NO475_03630 [Candidatus Methanomethylicia archaeon]|nr:hypothetical protein [Candidatus Methanomethylicia archaeon]
MRIMKTENWKRVTSNIIMSQEAPTLIVLGKNGNDEKADIIYIKEWELPTFVQGVLQMFNAFINERIDILKDNLAKVGKNEKVEDLLTKLTIMKSQISNLYNIIDEYIELESSI